MIEMLRTFSPCGTKAQVDFGTIRAKQFFWVNVASWVLMSNLLCVEKAKSLRVGLLRGATLLFLFGSSFAITAHAGVGSKSPSDNLEAQAKRPNIVFFLVDDLGWGDLGYSGSTFYESPNIDNLARSGMTFSQAYASCPVCSPTRASILTGKHPVQVDVTDWIPGSHLEPSQGGIFKLIEDRENLALEEVTLAEVLKSEKYQTFFAGKWHLGSKGHWPTDQGFDVNVGGTDVGSPPGGYYAPWKNENLTANSEGEYLTERLTDEALDFLDERDSDRPFLLYLSYYNVHTPITPYRKRIEYFAEKAEQQFGEAKVEPLSEREGLTRTRQDNPAYASMIAAVDESVGRIEARLKQLELDDETIVCFTSDNGGLSTLSYVGPTSNLPLRAGKGWLYEGGVRVPMIIRAPGVTSAASQSDTPIVSTDFFPTLLDLAKIPVDPEWEVNGKSLKGILSGNPEASLELENRTLYWHYPHYHGSTWKPGASIRQGDWKLIEFYHYGTFELYNLKSDPGEQKDLSQEFPLIASKMQDLLSAWQTSNKARMPVPNDQ